MKLMRLFLSIVLLSLFSFASSNLIKDPFLWHVSKGKTEFYLFGTMHLADPSMEVLPAELKRALERSDAVYTEVEMSPAIQMAAVKLMMRNDGKTLKSILPAPLYERGQNYLRSIDPSLHMQPFEKMKLWAFSAALQFLEAQLKHPAVPAIDATIFQYASVDGKEVGGIETIEEQLAVFEAFNEQEQLLMHEATLAYLEKNRDYVEKISQLYKSGDEKLLLHYLTTLMFQEEKYRALEERFMQLLLYDRNHRMKQRIVEKITQSPQKIYLFAFGVMHFLDNGSVIELLKNEGFTVKRIK